MRFRKQGIPVSEQDLRRIFYAQENLRHYSSEELAQGIAEQEIGEYPYLVTKGSLFYWHLRAEGKKNVYLFKP